MAKQIQIEDAEVITEAFEILTEHIHEIAVEHGWWEKDRNVGEAIALMHSELSEALEGDRHGDPPSEHIPRFSAVEEELADVVIRVLDFAKGFGYDIPAAVMAKVEFNNNRPYKHGGKSY